MHILPATPLWIFAPGFDPPRCEQLSEIKDFSQVIELVVNSVQFIHLEPCKGRDPELQEYVQPVYTIDVSADAFDAFFNSPAGYRACHLQEANLGLFANMALISALADTLCDEAQHRCISDLASINIRTSILAASAKVWIHEDDFPFHCVTKDLAVESWTKAATAGDKKAIWGLCAPTGTRLQVKGALLNFQGNEEVPRKKVLRRYEIQRLGFS